MVAAQLLLDLADTDEGSAPSPRDVLRESLFDLTLAIDDRLAERDVIARDLARLRRWRRTLSRKLARLDRACTVRIRIGGLW